MNKFKAYIVFLFSRKLAMFWWKLAKNTGNTTLKHLYCCRQCRQFHCADYFLRAKISNPGMWHAYNNPKDFGYPVWQKWRLSLIFSDDITKPWHLERQEGDGIDSFHKCMFICAWIIISSFKWLCLHHGTSDTVAHLSNFGVADVNLTCAKFSLEETLLLISET